MGKPFIDFAAVKAVVTITQVLERYGILANLRPLPSRDGFVGRCPIHQGTSPDQFKVSVSKNCWNCFGDCKGGGNVLDFVAQMESITAHEAAHRLNEWFELHLDQADPPSRPATSGRKQDESPREGDKSSAPGNESPPRSPDDSPESPRTNAPLQFELKDLKTDHPYLAERGLTPETVEAFGLGFCSKGTMSGRIVIPIHNIGGSLVGYAGRWPGPPDKERPKYKLPKDFLKSAEVFNLHRVLKEDPTKPIIITEGYFDVMALWQHGWRRTVSIMGSHLSATQEHLLLTAAQATPTFILLFDEDEAGQTGRLKALQILAFHAFVRVVRLPRAGVQPDHMTREDLHTLLASPQDHV